MSQLDLSKLDSKKYILIKGARSHNLKNIDIAICRNQFVVITGLSGSGKSSLAFDTLYAEGQRRYVESLSSYARQFLGRMDKPEVDYIKGISPAIAIEQKVNNRNPRSTVGTSTEIYDYLKLLYARIGHTYSPISGEIVKRDTVTEVTDFILSRPVGSKVYIYSPLLLKEGRSIQEQLQIILQQGFSRITVGGALHRVEEVLGNTAASNNDKEWLIVIDRLILDDNDPDFAGRIADSVQTAFFEGHGACFVDYSVDAGFERKAFNNRFEADGLEFEEPSVNLFSFNNPYGACKSCEGFGSVIGIDEDMVIPNKSLSIFEEAVACWKGEKMSEYKDQLVLNAYKFDFPIHKPYYELTPEQKALLWDGNKYFTGIHEFFRFVEEQTYKIQYRVMLSRYRGKTSCQDCKGTRLRKDATYVKINGISISDMVVMPIEKLLEKFHDLRLNTYEEKIARRLLTEIISRLSYLCDVGLGYLTLNRLSASLSGGESQRINLATSLGSSLVGSMYILDEPSIGLHPRDTERLIKVLQRLRDLGNTVIVVEHDEEIIRAADQIVDLGPLAGEAGGHLVFSGPLPELMKEKTSLTALYLNHDLKVKIPEKRQGGKEFIEVFGARENNLKNLTIKFPLNQLIAVTGVSGSGKTSLVKKILFPALKKIYGGYGEKTGDYDHLGGDFIRISDVEMVDQNPIGRSTRSNPATYVKAFDEIRSLFAEQALSRLRGYRPGFFSFNIEGGRCEECEGEGTVKIEMQFMADITLICESCHGTRFKEEVLDIKYNDKNISEVLNFTIDQAIEFFSSDAHHSQHRIIDKLLPLKDVGLGYLRMGQPSSTLSGGEAQRIKLASFLSKGISNKPTLFIFDEPTTGLHFHDISKLIDAMEALLEHGHSIIVIEHNMEIVKCADWVIDLGPEGGDEGGRIMFEGSPEQLALNKDSHTGRYLAGKYFSSEKGN